MIFNEYDAKIANFPPMEEVFGRSRVDHIMLNKEHKLFVLRDDLIHPLVSGNKWRKLKYNIRSVLENNQNTIITFGGAFSNHLTATAAAGKIFGIKTIGIVRGEKISNPRLDFMQKQGMKLHFISREAYRKKTEEDFLQQLMEELSAKNLLLSQDRLIFLPEGGSNALAVTGTEEIVKDIPEEVTTIFCAVGTGGTIAGISGKLKSHQRLKAVPVLKAANFLEKDIEKLGGDLSKIDFLYDYHFGGYAKTTPELNQFCKSFFEETAIPIEPVYTGKAFFACANYLKVHPMEKVLVVHTGGVFFRTEYTEEQRSQR